MIPSSGLINLLEGLREFRETLILLAYRFILKDITKDLEKEILWVGNRRRGGGLHALSTLQ